MVEQILNAQRTTTASALPAARPIPAAPAPAGPREARRRPAQPPGEQSSSPEFFGPTP